MPVLSPHRSSSSGLTGSYRSTFSSSTLDRNYYGTTSYSPRFSTYSERYTTRSYADSDGRRIFSRYTGNDISLHKNVSHEGKRTGSITEDGLTSRFREESRETSVRRDSLRATPLSAPYAENSIYDSSRRDSSLSRSEGGRSTDSRLSSGSVIDSVADLRNKYSPANYVPAVLRNKENISRSKTLNDIGLPPIESAPTKKKVTEANLNTTAGVRDYSNNTNCIETDNMNSQEDDNGNRPSVSEMRKKFDGAKGLRGAARSSPLAVDGVRISENRFKKLDGAERDVRKIKPQAGGDGTATKSNGHIVNGRITGSAPSKTTSRLADKKQREKPIVPTVHHLALLKKPKCRIVPDEGNELKGGRAEVKEVEKSPSPDITLKPSKAPGQEKSLAIATATIINNHVSNFASYIPNKDFDKEDAGTDVTNGADVESINNAIKIKKTNKDITTSPRLNRSPISQNAGGANSVSVTEGSSIVVAPQRGSSERDGYGSRTSTGATSRGLDFDRSSPSKQNGLNGLKNIGNTCFMNSVIQCLSNTKPLLEYLKKEIYVTDINTTTSGMKGALIKAFAQVIKELWSEDSLDRVVNTSSLKSQIQRFAPRFMGYLQQDAQEFLRYLLEGLHEDVNRVTAKPTPIHTEIDEKLSDNEKAVESWQRYVRRENSKVVDIFVGQLKSTLKCTHCGHCSVTFDPFWDLSLPIPSGRSGPIRLSECLDSFTREETLDGDEKPTCSKCKERRKCTKSFTIHKFPKILVIHLKRFSPTERFKGKLNVTVSFPLEGLDMSNYAAESHTQCRYNLYAISNHSGTTYSGHYTAYCRHPYSQNWHEYNDSRVSSISRKVW